MNKNLVFISLTVALGGLLFGFDTAVVAGTLTYLKTTFQLSDALLGWVVSSALVGCIAGALVAGPLADKFGRRPLLMFSAIMFVICALGCSLSNSPSELVLYRVIGGVGVGMASVLCPIYISEIAPAAYRGRFMMMQQITIVVGILVSYASNWTVANAGFMKVVFNANADNYWRLMFGAAIIPSVIFLIALLFVPESPRWLIAKNKNVKAFDILSSFNPRDKVLSVIQDVKDSLKESRKTTLQEVFATRHRKRLAIGITFAGVAQLTGINIIFYYAPMIFEQTNTGTSTLFQTILTGVVNLVFTVLALFFIDKLGRKRLMLFGSLSMALTMLILSGVFYMDLLDSYFVLILILLYIAFFAVSWGATIWVYIAEIFPTHIRGAATSLATFTNWTMNFLVSFTFPMLLSALGGAGIFAFYALFNLISFFFVYKFIFETKGASLEEIQNLEI